MTSWLQAEHPECPGRVEAVVSRLQELWGSTGGSSGEVQWLPSARVAAPEDLALVHPERYVAAVQAACARLQVCCTRAARVPCRTAPVQVLVLRPSPL